MYKRSKGILLIEMLLVMMLLVIFGLTTFTLVTSGSRAYSKLVDQKNDNSQLRTSISFVNTKILQNETYGSFNIRKSPSGYGDALVINQRVGNEKYENWIYCSNGKLREAIVKAGILPNDELSMEISAINKFTVHFTKDRKGIFVKVTRSSGKVDKSYSTVIAIIVPQL